MHGDDWFTFAELSQRLGALVWVEDQLASVLASWSELEPHPASAVLFATVSGHHLWHADIVRSCLPTSPQLRQVEVVQPPTSGWARAVESLQSFTDADDTSIRLGSLVKVIDPWIAKEESALLGLARPISDAAFSRWLRFAAIDHHDDAARAKELLAMHSADATRFDDHVRIGRLRLDEFS